MDSERVTHRMTDNVERRQAAEAAIDIGPYADKGDPRQTDAKGRPHPDTMSDRDLLVELVVNMRAVADAVDGLADSPMVRAMMSGSNPLAAMMGR